MTDLLVALTLLASLAAAAAAFLALRSARRSAAEVAGLMELATTQGKRRGREHGILRNLLGQVDQHHAERLARIERITVDLQRELIPARTTVHTGDDIATAAVEVVRALTFEGARPQVVLLLQSFSAAQLFAGIRTAVATAAELAARLGLPLRVVVLEPTADTRDDVVASLGGLLTEMGHDSLVGSLVVSVDGARELDGHTTTDVWVATFWTTAWALADLADAGLVSRDRVVYLVQDWEPSFYPWGDLNAKARSTYSAGFHRLVNSRSLARYVSDQSRSPVADDEVFSPDLDVTALAAAGAAWHAEASKEVRVLFYARPSKPRNMFNLGLQALREWADLLDPDVQPVVRLAGEHIGEVDLGPRVRVEVRGKTSYEEYYALLADTDIGLALMNSPHPGHLALELPTAGIPTVTNQFEGYREPWIEGLVVADPHPRAIARALADVTRSSRRDVAVHRPGRPLSDLGGTLADAVEALAERLEGHGAAVAERR